MSRSDTDITIMTMIDRCSEKESERESERRGVNKREIGIEREREGE
jgi:hypothetical protein